MKYLKEITLALAPYKTVKIGVSEASDFKECDSELGKELDRMPAVKELNQAEIKKVLN